jgi:hypothetical protein
MHARTHARARAHANTHTHTHTHTEKHKAEVLFVTSVARNCSVWDVYLAPEPFSLKFKPGKLDSI